MKTAEEWESCRQREGLTYWSLPNSNSSDYKYMDRAMIEQIQLDAMKEGARRAGQICNSTIDGNGMADAAECHTRILSVAKQWTEKDL